MSVATAKPRRWLAILLSLLMPGLGHAYAGAPLRGIAIVVAVYVGFVPLIELLARSPALPTIAALGVAGVIVFVAIVVDAARMAARPRTRFLGRGSVLLVCLGFIAASIPIQLAWERWRTELPQSFYAPSAGMDPTVLIGDHFFVDSRTYEPARGDVIVFRLARGEDRHLVSCRENPQLACEAFIKRIVGVPGDTIRFDGAVLYLNDEPVTGEPSGKDVAGPNGEEMRLRPESLGKRAYHIADTVDVTSPGFENVIVERDRYYVAGDHRDNSNDSRYYGTIPREDIIGAATQIYWSWDNRESYLAMLNPAVLWRLLHDETRWDRIGQTVE